MYDILKNVISRKAYNFADMLAKIDTLWSEGKLTDTEREELNRLAQDNASIENSVNVTEKLVELEKRIKNLEMSKTDTNTNTSSTETIEDYVKGKWYHNGDAMRFNGKVYDCVAEPSTVVYWSPAESILCWEERK